MILLIMMLQNKLTVRTRIHEEMEMEVPLLYFPVYFQVWQGANHIVVVAPIDLDRFRKTQLALGVLLSKKMLLSSSPPHNLPLSSYPESLC